MAHERMETETCSTDVEDAMLDGRVLDRRRVWPLLASGNEPGISLSSTVAVAVVAVAADTEVVS